MNPKDTTERKWKKIEGSSSCCMTDIVKNIPTAYFIDLRHILNKSKMSRLRILPPMLQKNITRKRHFGYSEQLVINPLTTVYIK